MSVALLVTRPAPDNQATADALRRRGFEPLLAPMLVFQPLPLRAANLGEYTGVIFTSANAIRAIQEHPVLPQLQRLPAFVVGDRTAQSVRDVGFASVHSAQGDAAALRELIVANLPLRKRASLLYLSAEETSRDLAGELGLRGVEVTSIAVYRMSALDELPTAVCDAFAQGAIEAVLHYSRRSALAFIKAARAAGFEISALALPQACLSDQIAASLREAGATRVVVAAEPNEDDLLSALEHALRGQRSLNPQR
jgi:uroporphyrinogen-III synthase